MTTRRRGQRRKKPVTIKDIVPVILLVSALICLAVVTAVVFVSGTAKELKPEPLSATEEERLIEEGKPIPDENVDAKNSVYPDEKGTGALEPAAKPEVLELPSEADIPVDDDEMPRDKTETYTSPSDNVSTSTELTERDMANERGLVAFVIDDAGYNLSELEPFLAFPGPLTIAVLPGLPYSVEAARRVREAGKDVILHQPMEAEGGQNPGPGAIDGSMTSERIRSILEKNYEEVGPIVGMNNHQGSKTTSDEQAMAAVLAFCRDKGIYYLDSRTTAQTVVPAVAARIGIRIGERDVFIDNIQQREEMIRYVRDGLRKAEKKGAAVMIGHVWSADLAQILRDLYPELIDQGFSLSTVAKMIMGTADDEGFGD